MAALSRQIYEEIEMEHWQDGIATGGTAASNTVQAVAAANCGIEPDRAEPNQSVGPNDELLTEDGFDCIAGQDTDQLTASLDSEQRMAVPDTEQGSAEQGSEQRSADARTWMNPRFYPGLIPASGGMVETIDDKEVTLWVSTGGEVIRTIDQQTGESLVEVKQRDNNGKLHLVQNLQFNNQSRDEYILQDVHGVIRV